MKLFSAVASLALLAFTGPAVFGQNLSVSVSSTYQGGGVVAGISKSASINLNGTNVNVIPFTCGTLDSSISISPITSNAYITIINTSATNSENFIKVGNTTGVYTLFVRQTDPPLCGRLLPGGDGLVHVACSNGTQTGLILIPPNP